MGTPTARETTWWRRYCATALYYSHPWERPWVELVHYFLHYYSFDLVGWWTTMLQTPKTYSIALPSHSRGKDVKTPQSIVVERVGWANIVPFPV